MPRGLPLPQQQPQPPMADTVTCARSSNTAAQSPSLSEGFCGYRHSSPETRTSEICKIDRSTVSCWPRICAMRIDSNEARTYASGARREIGNVLTVIFVLSAANPRMALSNPRDPTTAETTITVLSIFPEILILPTSLSDLYPW